MARAVSAAIVVALSLTLAGCHPAVREARVAGPVLADPESSSQVPLLQEPQFGGSSSTTKLNGESLTAVKEAAPPGLHVTSIAISPLSPLARKALHFKGFKGGGPDALVHLPLFGLDPQLGFYYLAVPVVNDGPAPVRNLKARADFFDANGVLVWSETEPVTYFPTRLGLNPPSLPNTRNVAEPGRLGTDIKNFSLYYFSGNVGIFNFSVPDTTVAKTVARWEITFLVSTT
ncbi:MAG: hypothetical protein NVSMB57_00350 [Actinomycetota bacterium]